MNITTKIRMSEFEKLDILLQKILNSIRDTEFCVTRQNIFI